MKRYTLCLLAFLSVSVFGSCAKIVSQAQAEEPPLRITSKNRGEFTTLFDLSARGSSKNSYFKRGLSAVCRSDSSERVVFGIKRHLTFFPFYSAAASRRTLDVLTTKGASRKELTLARILVREGRDGASACKAAKSEAQLASASPLANVPPPSLSPSLPEDDRLIPTLAPSLSLPNLVSPAPFAVKPIPAKSTWESHMITFGRMACDTIFQRDLSTDELLTATYYDGAAVFYQVKDYTHDTSWNRCAERALHIYRDLYVIPNSAKVPGYWNFSQGDVEHFLRTGDQLSRTTALNLSRSAAFTPDQTPLTWSKNAAYSREVAYAILSYLGAERLGEPRRPRLNLLVAQALSHLDQWQRGDASYMRPFMVGITMEALISYYEVTRDDLVLQAISRTLDWLWDRAWLPRNNAFMFTDRKTSTGGTEPAPDLNLIIAPAYAWAYHHTGEPRFLERGDRIFAGGVQGAWLNNTKQFHQSYLWSFRYIKYREQLPLR